MTASDPTSLSTVSSQFIEDWIAALHSRCTSAQLAQFLQQSGMQTPRGTLSSRITLDQIFRLYQLAAIETGDEMMGLWSRPIRSRALQHLLTTVCEASSLPAALHRFSTFWNLLLDDCQLRLTGPGSRITLELDAQYPQTPQRFGHMLILKLAHGLLSWLAGYEVPVASVRFAFPRPGFAEDYAVIFPAPVSFSAAASAISFDADNLGPAQPRSKEELALFLGRAPRDWIFTGFREHTRSLRVRDFLFRASWAEGHLHGAANALNTTPRTLMRSLKAEGTSFQAIKDGLRRDLAIRDLQAGGKSIEEISQDLGFSSPANFHRAFLRWTGGRPSAYRRPPS